jgi:hydantoinase/carbamoylase family amidase
VRERVSPPEVDAGRVIADLRELDRRTGGPRGAQRVCWGDAWERARDLLTELLGELGIEPERDDAGNLWAYLEGDANPAVAVGSHLDSVPGGGWLDGALGVMAALGVLRTWSERAGRPPRTLALVDWADEEGARFGRSLFGSSAFSGTLDPDAVRGLRDADGAAAGEVLAAARVDLDRAPQAARRRERVGAYLELHIEQGPALESRGLPVAAVAGCAGVERHRLRFRGQAAHAGTTPMDARRDAGLAAAETALAIERIARAHAGVGTTGGVALVPGIATAVAGKADLLCDLRHRDGAELAAMLAEAIDAASAVGAARGCDLDCERVWAIEPIRFDARLVEMATEEARAAGGATEPLISGALHDAAEVARVVPAAMTFTSSRGGISHAREEDTAEADLSVSIASFGRLVGRVLESDLPGFG